jgi:hypothetical protein
MAGSMGRRTGTTGVLAGLATGIGLWFTRAALDVVPGRPGGTRVGMLSSWPDLVGLTCLVLLSAYLVRACLERFTRPAIPGVPRPAGVPPHVLAPLFLTLLLGLPYLPWLPDAVPVLRVLAGPARYGLWIVAAGLMIWLVAERDDRAQDAAGEQRTRGALLLVFAATLIIVGTAAGRLVGHGRIPGGDEPHYLVIAQSLVTDHDLQIENNHRQRDYAPYFAGELRPDYIARGRDGVIYSIHPVGLPLLVAPAYAIGGYHAVVVLLVLIAAIGAALLWRVALGVTRSAGAATTAWLAIAGSTTFVLHGFAVYPEVPAAVCALLALCGIDGGRECSNRQWWLRGLAVAALPWLGTKYSLMALVIVAALALRLVQPRSWRALAAVVIPFGASVACWFAFFWMLWGVPSPTAPYGTATQTSLANLRIGAPALFVDQEYGLFAYAPALVLAVPGLWRMWRDGGDARRLAVEIAMASGALVATVGAYQMWWGGSAAPGRQIGAAILLAGVPIARWDAHVRRTPLRRALVRVLVLVGLAVSTAMVFARDGLLAANARDGTSRLLEWLGPAHELVRTLPSAIAFRDAPATFYGTVTVWLVIVLAASWIARRWQPRTPGAAGGVAGVLLLGVVMAASLVVPVVGARTGAALAARADAPLLEEYDARRRPVAVVYDPWRTIDPAAVPPLFAFDGVPGLRRAPQPLRLLFNTRLALPAGTYALRLEPAPGAAIRGRVGLQVGRMGPAMIEWPLDGTAGQPWSTSFTLGVDSNFVGLRAEPAFEPLVSRLTIVPERVENASDRREAPTVVAAMRYGHVDAYFHNADVYPERTGFWVRGRGRLLTTFVQEPPADADPAIVLRLHSGAAATVVRFETVGWETSVELKPGEARELRIPARPGTRVVPVRISPAGGFVPAERDGGADRRLLGCWVEVAD